MPTYCFRSRDKQRKLIERVFNSSEVPKSFKEGGRIFDRSHADEWGGISVPSSSGWPMECVASGVHASQAGELRKFFSDHGCPTEVSKDGNPIYRNKAHRDKALKLRGFKDKSGYYH